MTTALLAGSSGLVGGHLLERLLADDRYEQVISLGRRPVDHDHPRLEQLMVDFAALPALPAVDVAFSCLGTTIRKAGSQAAFRAVDHDAVLAVATAARQAGATGFFHVSALGADPRSRIFYNRVKGEVERDVAALGLPRWTAVQPSILDGERDESRPAERLGLVVMRAAGPLLGRYRPTHAVDVAAAMVSLASVPDPPPVLRAGDIPRWAARPHDLGGPAGR